MRGRSRRQCLEKAKRDAADVIKKAAAIITISLDNKNFEFVKNKDPRLGVLAVIGPAKWLGKKFDKVVLAEIGIGPSRPYHAARGLNQQPYNGEIPKRGKWFNLTEEQYKLVAPFVFKFLEKTGETKIAKWKSGPYFWLLTQRNYWSHCQKKLFCDEQWKKWPKGTRFSFSKKDYLFIADIFWAEINLNQQLIYELGGLARFIDKRLRYYKSPQYYKGIRPFKKLKGAQDVENAVYRFPSYLRQELLNYLPNGRGNYFYNDLQDLFGLLVDKCPEKILADEAEKLSNPRERLRDIQLRITSGINNPKKDYIVIEVFPLESVKSEESLDHIPF